MDVLFFFHFIFTYYLFIRIIYYFPFQMCILYYISNVMSVYTFVFFSFYSFHIQKLYLFFGINGAYQQKQQQRIE